MMTCLSIHKSCVLSVLTVVLVGCGGPSEVPVTIEQTVFAQIEGLGDAAGDEAVFNDAFAPGAAPSDRAAYGQHGYQVAGEATIEGDTATVPVKVFGGVVSSQEGDRAASASEAGESEQTWTLQKVGDGWKIKDAPLS